MQQFQPAKLPRPPKHLSNDSKRWWTSVVRRFVFTEADLPWLQGVAKAWNRAGQAGALLDRDGLTFVAKSGEIKRHPGHQIEHDSMIRSARFLRELRLDIEPPADSRPPALKARRP